MVVFDIIKKLMLLVAVVAMLFAIGKLLWSIIQSTKIINSVDTTGEEKLEAKQIIKMSFAYLFCILIFGAVAFFKVNGVLMG